MPLSTSILLAGAVALVAWRGRWLAGDGTLAAWIVGTAVLGFGGLRWAAVLITFFATGTALTRIGHDRKTQPEHTGSGRTAAQVFCTGGIGAVLATISGVAPGAAAAGPMLHAAFLGSLAAVSADTWATEIGMLSARPPRLITTGRVVPPGTSGAVTALGTGAGMAGAGVIAAVGAWGNGPLFASVTIAGVLAMLADSILGATVQATYRDARGAVGEVPQSGGVLIRGVRWVTNPVVNLAASLCGAAIAAVLQR
jgi:uncharacterized protein (TIGR00297 family)